MAVSVPVSMSLPGFGISNDREVQTELLKGAREVLPFFALPGEKGSRPAADLKKAQITLLVNGRNVRDFSLHKKPLNASANDTTSSWRETREKGRRIYMFIDTFSLSGSDLEQVRWLAGYIMRTTHHTVPVGILVADRARGLVSSGPLSPDRKKMLNWLNQRVTHQGGSIDPARNRQLLTKALRELYRDISRDGGSKLLYIFTGPNAARVSGAGAREFLNKASSYLGESGALTVIIQTGRPLDPETYPARLAKACGGLFQSGNKEQLVKRLDTLHGSYYEVVFPFLKEFGGAGGQIALTTDRKDIRLQSLHYLRKNKPVADIRMLQKKLLALNLLRTNDWYNLQLDSLNLGELKNKNKQKNTVYRFTLPAAFNGDEIEFFRITFNGKADEILMVYDSVMAGTAHVEVERGDEDYFVLMNPRHRAALVTGKNTELTKAESGTLNRAVSRLREKLETLKKEDKLILVRTRRTRKPGITTAQKAMARNPEQESAVRTTKATKTALESKEQILKKLQSVRNSQKDTAVMYYYELAIKYLRQDRVGHALHYLRKTPAGDKFVHGLIERLTRLDQETAGIHMKLDVFVEQSQSKAIKSVVEAAGSPTRPAKIKRLLDSLATVLEINRKHVDGIEQMLRELPATLDVQPLNVLPLNVLPGTLGLWLSKEKPFAVEDRLAFCRKKSQLLKTRLPDLERNAFIETGRIAKILNQSDRLLDRDDLIMQKVKQRLTDMEKSGPELVEEFVTSHGHIFGRDFKLPYFKRRLKRLGAVETLLKQAPFFEMILCSRSFKVNEKGFWEADFGDGIVMIYIPGGQFTMGVPWESGGAQDESPQHSVELDPYWIAKFETTFEQYDRFCLETGRGEVSDFGRGRKKRPVAGVSWKDARGFSQWLSERTGLGFRLPTEAEWEKAARGTAKYSYPWGNTEPGARHANFADLKFLKKYRELNPPGNDKEERSLNRWIAKSINDGYIYTAPVGAFPDGSSPYGVMDMAGNVWEWVWDWYDDDYYHRSPKRNPIRDSRGTYKVARGGGWDCHPWLLRSTGRAGCDPQRGNDTLGFRVALVYNPGGHGGHGEYGDNRETFTNASAK